MSQARRSSKIIWEASFFFLSCLSLGDLWMMKLDTALFACSLFKTIPAIPPLFFPSQPLALTPKFLWSVKKETQTSEPWSKYQTRNNWALPSSSHVLFFFRKDGTHRRWDLTRSAQENKGSEWTLSWVCWKFLWVRILVAVGLTCPGGTISLS